MNKSAGDHNFPTFRMCHYGYELSRDASQPALGRQAFYLKCHSDDDFKASYAPFLDLEYVESHELQEDAAVTSSSPSI